MSKLTSRKFWISAAAFLAAIGTGIAGIVTDNQVVATVGIVCTILASAIYAACEAYVDGASIKANTSTVSITATSNDRTVVASALKKDNAETSTTESK